MKPYTNEWYTYPKDTIDRKTCAKLIGLPKDKWEESAVGIKADTTDEERRTGVVLQNKPDPKERLSEVHGVNDQWIYDMIWPYMEDANQEAGWRYHIKAAESPQITRYRKGGFYKFHTDGQGDHLSTFHNPQNAFMYGHVKKLSMSIMLNDNFEGGAFEFASYAKEQCNITPIEASAGSIIVFPSCMEHRVAPVTKGIRYSLVTWFLRPPFV